MLSKNHNRILFFIPLVVLLIVFIVIIPARADSTLIITLDANGGKFPAQLSTPERTARDQKIELDDNGKNKYSINIGTWGKPEWEGKTLVGWSTKADAKDPDYEWQTLEKFYTEYVEPKDREKVPLDGSITYLYAIWADTYYITLNANGGNFGTNTDKYGHTAPIETMEGVFWYSRGGLWRTNTPGSAKRNSDEVQKGWSSDRNAVKPEYNNDFEGLMLNSSTPQTLYAVYGREGDRSSDYNAAVSGNEDKSGSSPKPDEGSKAPGSDTHGSETTNPEAPGSETTNPETSGSKNSYTVGIFSYTVKNNIATIAAPKSKTAKTVSIPATVKINGKSVPVTSVAPNAFKGMKKLTSVTIGKNVKKIGKNAFNGCKKLKKITIRTTKLTKNSIGANAFKGINKKAVIKCPKSKKAAYKKILLKKGMKKTMTFK